MDQEWQRLQGLYAAMSDDELLELARKKAELTEVAQQVVDTEMSSRGLTVSAEDTAPVEQMPELEQSDDDPSLVELMTFQIPADAERALHELDDHGIPLRMKQAMRRFTADGPLIKTNWLTIYVETERKEEAVAVLRQRMGLFPVLTAEEARGQDDDEGGDDLLAIVGTFDVDEDAEIARRALTDAGIWFNAWKEAEDGAEFAVTTIEVRAEDGERALEVVEAAFAEAE